MELLDGIKGRRAINFFDPQREVEEKTLMEILKIAWLAPSSFNLQPWEVIVVKSKEEKKILREIAFGQPKVEEASAVLIIIANPEAVEENLEEILKNRLELGYMKKEQIEVYRNMPKKLYGEKESTKRKIFAAKNAGLFAMNLMLAARGYGLETHPMDGFDEEKLKERYKIDKEKLVPMLIALGYPKKDLKLFPQAHRFFKVKII
ncbi:MAG: nitroreductase family protein [Thermoanaerobaculia bacterium]